jgi:hypothetical protein
MRVLGRAQVPDKYHSTTVVPRASTTVLVPRAIARGTTYLVLGTWYLVLGTGLGTCIKTEGNTTEVED